MKKVKKKRVTFYMDVDLFDAITEMSTALDMAKSQIVGEASREYLIKNARKLKTQLLKRENALREVTEIAIASPV